MSRGGWGQVNADKTYLVHFDDGDIEDNMEAELGLRLGFMGQGDDIEGSRSKGRGNSQGQTGCGDQKPVRVWVLCA